MAYEPLLTDKKGDKDDEMVFQNEYAKSINYHPHARVSFDCY